MTLSETPDAPSAYLTGHFAPVPDEIEARELPVTGALPPELTGRYFRNGPNPLPGQDPGHWFTGPGMIHGIRLRNGRAEWYRNRWVRTRALHGTRYLGPDGRPDLTAVTANTHVIRHADAILALVENGLPYRLTPELDTVGPYDFGGRLATAMTAHPKRDPATGELHFFGYGVMPPYVTYHRVAACGALVESRPVEVPGPTMMHDFAITEHHVVWLDLPVVFDSALLGRGMPYRWDDGYGARLGVMPRDGEGAATVRWYDVEPGYVFHVGNAHEDDRGRIVLDAVRYDRDGFGRAWGRIGGVAQPVPGADGTRARLHRWVLDPGSGRVREEQLDDRNVEFPTLNEDFTGVPGRFLYAVSGGSLIKYDTVSGAQQAHAGGPRRQAGEAVFVPARDGRAEDEGWLLSIVSDRSGTGSELIVLDAHDLGHVASVRLPRRVPAGFHGSWLPDADPNAAPDTHRIETRDTDRIAVRDVARRAA